MLLRMDAKQLVNNSWRTAKPISNGPSRLVRYCEINRLFTGNILDFGAGKLRNTTWLRDLNYKVAPYDPFAKELKSESISKRDVANGSWNTVSCNMVINVLPIEARDEVILTLADLCADRYFIEVQSDLSYLVNPEKFQDGYVTKMGTFQKAIQKDELLEIAKDITKLNEIDYSTQVQVFGSNVIGIIMERN